MDIVKQGDLFFEKNDSGKVIGLVFSGENLEAEIEAIKENQIDSIAFNRLYSRDRINNLNFLKEIPFIKKVGICDDDFDIDGLYNLEDVEELLISEKRPLDYSRFKKLRVLSICHSWPYSFSDSIQKLQIRSMKLKGSTLGSIRFP